MCRTPPRFQSEVSGPARSEHSEKPSKDSDGNYSAASFASGFLKIDALGWQQFAGAQADMWDLVVEAAQSPALHWSVVACAVLALVYKVLTDGEGLMADMYGDEFDS
jgi:hypothetical protein